MRTLKTKLTNEICERIKKKLKENKMTYKKLSDKSGISETRIKNILSRKTSTIDDKTIYNIASILNCSYNYILFGIEDSINTSNNMIEDLSITLIPILVSALNIKYWHLCHTIDQHIDFYNNIDIIFGFNYDGSKITIKDVFEKSYNYTAQYQYCCDILEDYFECSIPYDKLKESLIYTFDIDEDIANSLASGDEVEGYKIIWPTGKDLRKYSSKLFYDLIDYYVLKNIKE